MKSISAIRAAAMGAIITGASIGANAADDFNFTVASYNIDGLPSLINADGPGSDGTTVIGQRIVEKGWDLVGICEDFAYHVELENAVSEVYNLGLFRGNVTTILHKNDTDGLGFLWKNTYEATGETFVSWNVCVGDVMHGADELIDKGFRYYCAKLSEDYAVDVYVLHMNSESSAEAIAAKHSQLQQLVSYIKATDNKRPILIVGDTNCRYTRENLQKLLIDAINADARFEIRDPWVDYMHNGYYPQVGDGDLLVDDLGWQNAEIVDKVFYINNKECEYHITANSYLCDDSFRDEEDAPLADHFPVVVDFTIKEGAPEISDLAFGNNLYITNVATGQYLFAGATWGTHGVVDDNYGLRCNMAPRDGSFAFSSTLGYMFKEDDNNVYMDGANIRTVWSITPAATEGAYVISADGLALAPTEDGVVMAVELDETDLAQQWYFTEEADRIEALKQADLNNQMDATFLLRGARCVVNDADNEAWTFTGESRASFEKWGTNEWNDKQWCYRMANSKKGAIDLSKSTWSLATSASNLPDGRYNITLSALTGNLSADSYTFKVNDQEVVDAQGNPVKFANEEDGTISSEDAVKMLRENPEKYAVSYTFDLVGGVLNIAIDKTDNNSSATMMAFNNVTLTYMGTPMPIHVSFKEGYNTLMLPFEFSVPEGLTFYSADSYSLKEEEYWVLNLEQVAEPQPNIPYIVEASEDMDFTFYGFPAENLPATVKSGLLTGTYETHKLSVSEYGMHYNDEGQAYLLKYWDSAPEYIVEPYRAFIKQFSAPYVLTFYDEGIETGVVTPVQVSVKLRGGYDTMILPFDQEIPTGMEVFETNGYSHTATDYWVIKLKAVNSIQAHTPYIVKTASKITYSFTEVPQEEPASLSHGVLCGTYDDIVLRLGDYLLKTNDYQEDFFHLISNDDLYFTLKANHASLITEPGMPEVVTFYQNGVTTSISSLEIDRNAAVEVYNLAGIKVAEGQVQMATEGLSAGVYIIRQGGVALKFVKE